MRKTRTFVAAGVSVLLALGSLLATGAAASAEPVTPASIAVAENAPTSSTAPSQQLDCTRITVDYRRALTNGDHINLQFDPGAKQVNAYVDRNLGGYNDLGLRLPGGQTRQLMQAEVESGVLVWDYSQFITPASFTVTFVQTNETDTWPNLECDPTPDDPPVVCPAGTTVGEDGETCEEPPVQECPSGEVRGTDGETCDAPPVVDVSITKTHSDLAATAVEYGDTFSYFLTVTNEGTAAVTAAIMTDAVTTDLIVESVIVPTGWVDETQGNDVRVSGVTLAPRASGVIEVKVRVPAAPDYTAPEVAAGGGDPDPTLVLGGALLNTACVDAPFDVNSENDCSAVTIQRDELVANVFVRCINDAPYLYYSVLTSDTLAGKPITLTWTPDGGGAAPSEVVRELASGDSGRIEWPGTAFASNGNSIQWPGYRPLTGSDYRADGSLAADPALVYNGLVLDTSSATYPWRQASTVTFSVNPTLKVAASYPQATADCSVPRSADMTVRKTASVDRIEPGASFDYSIATKNVSIDSAVDPVRVTDVIPANIRVDDVQTDAGVFPRWNDCAVSGTDPKGFGGTLECTLLGPLGIGQSAPVITLAVTAREGIGSGSIVNEAELCWGSADSQGEVIGCADDSVTVLVSTPLAATGMTGAPWALGGAAAALMAGAVLLAMEAGRRRRQS